MSSTPDRNEPLPISTIQLAAGLQFAILLGLIVLRALWKPAANHWLRQSVR